MTIPAKIVYELEYNVLTREIAAHLEHAGFIGSEDSVGILQDDYQKIPVNGQVQVTRHQLRDSEFVLKNFSREALWAREVCYKRNLEGGSDVPQRFAAGGSVHYFRASDVLGFLVVWNHIAQEPFLSGQTFSIRR